MTSKNIVEAYKEFNGQLIILISGLSGSGKTALGENISRDFKLKLLDANKFYKPNFDEKVKLSNEKVVVNYDTDNATDWEKLNDEINSLKKDGVVVTGSAFPTDKINFKADYHIHLKISKQELKNNRMAHIEKHKDEGFDPETESLRINSLTYPYYLDVMKRMKFDKFIDVTDMEDDVVYDIVFDEVIKFINNNVYKGTNKRTDNDKRIDNTKTSHKTSKEGKDDDFVPSDWRSISSGESVYPDESDYYVSYTLEDD